MTFIPNQKLQKSVFGELITSHKTPVVQIANKYFIDPTLLNDLETFESTGGTTDNVNGLFRCQSGASVGGYGVIRSKDTLNYRAGQGVEGFITASFTTGVPLSLQFAGMFSLTDTLAFGYDGADFSVIHSYGGVAEVQRIVVTVTGAGTCTVVLDGDSVGISTTASTIQTNARELVAGLRGDSTINSKWRFEQVGASVFCISKTVGNKSGSFSISGGVTASISERTAGVAQTDNHTKQADWNIKTIPFAGFDTTKLNIYKITYGYLGSANITFSIYDAVTASFVDVHQIEWSNNFNITNISSPNLKTGWTSASLGSSATNLIVTGGSAAMFLEGDEVLKNNTFASFFSKGSVDTTLVNLVTLKNRMVYNDRFNLGKSFPLRIVVDNDHTKGLIVLLLRNADVAGTINYAYKDEFNSISLIDTAGTTVTNGTLVDAFLVEKGATSIIDLTILRTELLPEETFTVAVQTISGTGATVTASMTWKEEK